jgi:cob(I)alamin adenosyltransferase
MKARIYTKTGDLGETSLVGGTRISKSNSRLEAYGTLDELNSVLGIVRADFDSLADETFRQLLETRFQMVQNNLFNIGSRLACEDNRLQARLPGLTLDAMSALESDMDAWEASLPPLKEFILPGGSKPAAHAHLARTICRRAEREVVRLHESTPVEADHLVFLNRLSDWLFLLARMFNWQLTIPDVIWSKNKG